jgi:hypothetical protein
MTKSVIGKCILGVHPAFLGRGIINSRSLSALYTPDRIQRMSEGSGVFFHHSERQHARMERRTDSTTRDGMGL